MAYLKVALYSHTEHHSDKKYRDSESIYYEGFGTKLGHDRDLNA